MKSGVCVLGLLGLFALCLPTTALAQDDDWMSKRHRDTWYWGMSLGATVVTPLGDKNDVFEYTGEEEFGTGIGLEMDIPFDFGPYFQLYPFFRFGFGALNTSLYERELGIDGMTSSLFQIGIGGRGFLYLPDTFGERFRPYGAAYYSYTSLEVSKSVGTGKQDCSGGYCQEETETVFSAGYNGSSYTFGVGIRYDIPMGFNLLGDDQFYDQVTLTFEIDYSLNQWDEWAGRVRGEEVAAGDVNLSLDHLWFQFTVGFMM
jgi:hypothetical protein